MIGYIIFTASMTLAVACISYNGAARARRWPVGEILSEDASLPKIAAFVTALWILGKSFMIFSWWSPIVISLAGWLLAFALVMTLRKNVQPICVIGIFPALLLTILYISEEKPFGMLHKLFN